MLNPLSRNFAGIAEPHDHPEILDQDGIIRRISDQHIVTDDQGNKRISSIAYRASSDQLGSMSVDLQKCIEQAGHSPQEYVMKPPWIGSVRFTAGELRALELQVGADPLLPDLPYHGGVWGKFTKSQQKQLKNLAQWFVPIAGVDLRA